MTITKITREDRENRHQSVLALHRALIDVPGLGVGQITEIVPLNDGPEPGIYWQVGIQTRTHGMVHVFEETGDGVRILRRSAWGKSMRASFQAENPDASTLTTALCYVLIGRGTVPIQSRGQMRKVLAAARSNADYTFRIGVAHLLDHPEYVADWAGSEDPDRWEMVETAYRQALAINPKYGGFLPSFRNAGVRMDIMDVYEEAYIERAVDLLSTITFVGRP